MFLPRLLFLLLCASSCRSFVIPPTRRANAFQTLPCVPLNYRRSSSQYAFKVDETKEKKLPTTGLDVYKEAKLQSIMSEALHKMDILMLPDFLLSGHEKLRTFFQNCIDSVQVAPSTIPNAGRGLVATKDIAPGTVVSLYPVHSVIVNLNGTSFAVALNEDNADYFQQQNKDDDSYALHLIGNKPLGTTNIWEEYQGRLNVNVNPTLPYQDGWMAHFINDGAIITKNTEHGVLDYYKASFERQNCVIVPFGPSPLCAAVTTRSVEKGQELFCSYGHSYWLGALVEPNKTKWRPTPDFIPEQLVYQDVDNAARHVKEAYLEEHLELQSLFDCIDNFE